MDDLKSEITNRISALTDQDWAELQDIYERIINHAGIFSTFGGGQEVTADVMQMPYTIEQPIVSELRQFLIDKQLAIMFDWASWSEGKTLLNQDTRDICPEEAVMLLSAVMRSDRFSDGVWANLFESGNTKRLIGLLLTCNANDSR